ncbi:hypothetical protein M2341_000279 [Sphingobium sp. B7D2B]|uniref:TniB family NTP-binding protein n=1 Tax=Sphingobium sp. B7D2B TaxID=2940583 RepID=UPI002224A375|nr:TniB family NTP-binding protein [Sphingobium sp. B7D2B]MCW2364832.1 hypothetical protein [Sphingobium sp. B7D2B]
MNHHLENTSLRPELQEFLGIEGRDRLYSCWDRVWVPTPSTKSTFLELKDCMRAAPSTKPRGLIITGAADTGKSRTMEAFRDLHPPQRNPESEYAVRPVIYLIAPNDPDPTLVLKKILNELGHPLTYNPTFGDLRNHTAMMLKACRVGTVIIDEISDIQRDGRMNAKISDFLLFLKNLINEVGRPFVVGGTETALDMIASDDQMAGRLDKVLKLKPFTLAEFVKVLLSFERVLPLRLKSDFRYDEALIQAAFTLTQGYIGRLNVLLHDACQLAIESGEERITAATLERIQGRSIMSVGRRLQ